MKCKSTLDEQVFAVVEALDALGVVDNHGSETFFTFYQSERGYVLFLKGEEKSIRWRPPVTWIAPVLAQIFKKAAAVAVEKVTPQDYEQAKPHMEKLFAALERIDASC